MSARDELPDVLRALEWNQHVDEMLGRICVEPRAEELVRVHDDWKGAAAALGYDGEYGESVAGGASGLVSVLTTHKRHSESRIPFRVKAESAACRQLLEAFEMDSEARRLSKLRMHVGFAARAHCVEADAVATQCVMVTLTYRGTNDDWEPGHIRGFMTHVREWFRRQLPGVKCQYVWVAELQRRGVIHYHVALWTPERARLPKPDECGWWPHGFTRIEVARAAVPYLLKYLSKQTSKTLGQFPKGARIYGVGGLVHEMRRARRWLGLPAFIRGSSDIRDDWRRVVGGGWMSPGGNHYESEFRSVVVGGRRCLVRVHRHPRWIEADGPFNWFDPPAAVMAGL